MNEEEEKSNLTSPNEIFDAAKKMMLNGREPSSERDWERIVSFFAVNLADGLEESGTHLLCKIFNVPLTDKTINKIVKFQTGEKKKEKLKKVGGPKEGSYDAQI